jgi:hypothetical protein
VFQKREHLASGHQILCSRRWRGARIRTRPLPPASSHERAHPGAVGARRRPHDSQSESCRKRRCQDYLRNPRSLLAELPSTNREWPHGVETRPSLRCDGDLEFGELALDDLADRLLRLRDEARLPVFGQLRDLGGQPNQPAAGGDQLVERRALGVWVGSASGVKVSPNQAIISASIGSFLARRPADLAK